MIAWVIWICSALFFLYEFLLRILPSVMVPELMETFHVEAAELGFLSAFYFYIYAPMQLPVGILVDRFGAKRLLPQAIFICGIGTLLFAYAHHLGLAEFARVLMGFGSAFAFVSMLYIATHHLPTKHLSLLMGIGNSFGMLGAAGGEGPLTIAIHNFGWRMSTVGLGIFGIALSAIAFFLNLFSKEKAHHFRADTFEVAFKNLARVCKNPLSWINALVGICFYATTTAFAGLWCIPFLRTAHQLTNEQAGFATSLFFIGWILGGPLIGQMFTAIKRVKPLIIVFSLLGFISLSLVIYLPMLHVVGIAGLLFLTGFFSGAELLVFRYAIEVNPHLAKGSALAFTNFIIMLAGAFLQPLVGYLLEWEWKAPTIHLHQVPMYPTSDYQIALIIFPLSFLLTALFALFLNEKARVNHAENSV